MPRWLKRWLIARGYRNAETQSCWREVSELTRRLSPMLASNDRAYQWRAEAEK